MGVTISSTPIPWARAAAASIAACCADVMLPAGTTNWTWRVVMVASLDVGHLAVSGYAICLWLAAFVPWKLQVNFEWKNSVVIEGDMSRSFGNGQPLGLK